MASSPKEQAIRGNSLILGQSRFSGYKKIFFRERIVKHWNRLLREMVGAAPLEVFK